MFRPKSSSIRQKIMATIDAKISEAEETCRVNTEQAALTMEKEIDAAYVKFDAAKQTAEDQAVNSILGKIL